VEILTSSHDDFPLSRKNNGVFPASFVPSHAVMAKPYANRTAALVRGQLLSMGRRGFVSCKTFFFSKIQKNKTLYLDKMITLWYN
jgi:hypothetical protein